MEFTVSQLAAMLGGKVEGNSETSLNNLGKIENAQSNELTFLANPAYEKFIYDSKAGAILVANDFIASKPIKSTLIRVKDPYLAFTKLLKEVEKYQKFSKIGVEEPSYCSSSASVGNSIYRGVFSHIGDHSIIGENTKIYPQVYIGHHVKIGDNCIFFPGVKIYDHCTIGNNVIVHSGAVIGSDGFGFAPTEDGSYESIPQLGSVILEDDVNIGANTVVDRATLPGESTIIKKGAKLDNLIQVAHNVTVGESTVIAAQSGISGSTKIGKYCLFGGQVGIAGHLQIADRTQIGAQSGISKSVKNPGEKLMGSPAIKLTGFFKSYSVFKQLPEINRGLKELEEKVLNLPEF